MRRRKFIAVFGGAAVWPIGVGRAQQPDRIRRLGVILSAAPEDPGAKSRFDVFVQALKELGWTDGRNLQIELRWGRSDPNLFRAHAAELSTLAPDVILVATSAVLAAMKKETNSIPIVFAVVSDPDRLGFVETLARPGGNITGFTALEYSMGPKWLQLLKEIAPQVVRALVVFNPKTMAPVAGLWLQPIKARAPELGIKVTEASMQNTSELEAALMAFAREPGGGLVVLPDPFMTTHRAEIVELAGRYQIPALYPFQPFAASGGLMSYGPDLADIFRRSALYVDRILRGEKPADLPVQAPTKFESVINLKAARALGLTVPPSLLALADEVIE